MRFLNGIFTFLIHKNMENNDNPSDVSTIRKMYIDPSKFKDSIGKGMYPFKKYNYVGICICIFLLFKYLYLV